MTTTPLHRPLHCPLRKNGTTYLSFLSNFKNSFRNDSPVHLASSMHRRNSSFKTSLHRPPLQKVRQTQTPNNVQMVRHSRYSRYSNTQIANNIQAMFDVQTIPMAHNVSFQLTDHHHHGRHVWTTKVRPRRLFETRANQCCRRRRRRITASPRPVVP